MNKSLLYRGIIIAAVAALMVYFFWPPEKKIKLGLDLRGGIHLVLRVKLEDALRSERDKIAERLSQESQTAGGPALQMQPISPTAFAVTVPPGSREKVLDAASSEFAEWQPEVQGDRITFRLKEEERRRLSDVAVNQAVKTIDSRINAFGVAEPTIQRQMGTDRIVVQLPGVDDPERIKRLLKSTAFLEFRIVQSGPANTEAEALAAYNGTLPANLEVLEGPVKDEVSGKVVATQYYVVEKTARVTGRDLKGARPGVGKFNDPIVEFTLTHEAGQRFGELTQANTGKGLAIVLDHKVQSAPRINSRITDQGIIEGRFTQVEVQDLSTILSSGALPAGIETLEERTVGPSLGADSIKDGIRAGVVGAVLVVLMMVVVYHLSGLNAIAALVLNVAIIFGGLAYFGATLTLPGIAGVVLTMGMAVDANVLIFERIREELRAGRTPRTSIEEGFKRAFASVIDTHMTTLIAAAFLYQFGSGPVRGFAVTLVIGLTASLFTAVFVSHWLFDLELGLRKRVESISIG